MSLGFPSFEGVFYDIEDDIRTSYVRRAGHYEENYYLLSLQATKDSLMHQRVIYNALALIGDLGGVFDIFILIFVPFVIPYSQYSFDIGFI